MAKTLLIPRKKKDQPSHFLEALILTKPISTRINKNNQMHETA